MAGLSHNDLKIELTEGAIMADRENVRENLGKLIVAGFKLAADDFGTGYSSLAQLHALNFSELKIDRSFIARIGDPETPSDAIIRAILSMAAALGIKTVAEGIETRAQAAWLQNNGCEVGQGYFYSEPQAPGVLLEGCR